MRVTRITVNNNSSDFHSWLSGSKVLFIQIENSNRFSASAADVETGEFTRLNLLDNALTSTRDVQVHSYKWRLSPDRRFLLFCFDMDTGAGYRVASMDGQVMDNILSERCSQKLFWFRDGTGWLALQPQPQSGRYRAERYATGEAGNATVTGGLLLPDGIPIGFVRDGIVLVIERATQPTSGLKAWEINVESGEQRDYTIALPKRAHVAEIALSPNGEVLIWKLYHSYHIPRLSLRRNFPYFRLATDIQTSLWRSRSDGSAMNLIGYYDMRGSDFGPIMFRLDGSFSVLWNGVIHIIDP